MVATGRPQALDDRDVDPFRKCEPGFRGQPGLCSPNQVAALADFTHPPVSGRYRIFALMYATLFRWKIGHPMHYSSDFPVARNLLKRHQRLIMFRSKLSTARRPADPSEPLDILQGRRCTCFKGYRASSSHHCVRFSKGKSGIRYGQGSVQLRTLFQKAGGYQCQESQTLTFKS